MDSQALQAKFEQLIAEEEERPQQDEADNDADDAVFAQSFIPRSLAEVRARSGWVIWSAWRCIASVMRLRLQVVNVERDVAAIAEGRGSELIYSGLTGMAQVAALSEKKAAAAMATALLGQRTSANDTTCRTGTKPFDGAVVVPSLLSKGASAATPGGAVARLLEKLKLAAPAAAAAVMSDDDGDNDDDEEEIVMRVTVGDGDGCGEDGSESGSGGDEDADVVQSSVMGTVGGWGSAALSEKDKLTAARTASHSAAVADQHPAAAAVDDASSGGSSDSGSGSGDDEAAGTRGLDTSAGIPEGMTKAEWKKKVKEEKREKRKTKIPVRVARGMSGLF